jgi:hypothetical protein
MVYCSACAEFYCLNHWAEERRHTSSWSKVANSHRQIPTQIYYFIHATLNANIDSQTQSKLHEDDADTLWFGLTTEEETNPQFVNNEVYQELITLSRFPDHQQQFPSLISFVGSTGAGKSTLIVNL